MGKKKAGKTEESKKEDDQRPGSTRSGVNYQPRTSAERGAAIFTKGHLNPRELADMYRDYGQEEGEDWGARNTDDEDDETGLAARAQQPTAQDEQQGTCVPQSGPPIRVVSLPPIGKFPPLRNTETQKASEPSAEKEPSAERGAAICDQRPGGTMPGPTDSDRPGATQRPTQAGAHSSSSLEAEPALVGSDHAPPHNGAASGELQSAERDAELDRFGWFYHWGPDADSERRAYEEDRDYWYKRDDPEAEIGHQNANGWMEDLLARSSLPDPEWQRLEWARMDVRKLEANIWASTRAFYRAQIEGMELELRKLQAELVQTREAAAAAIAAADAAADSAVVNPAAAAAQAAVAGADTTAATPAAAAAKAAVAGTITAGAAAANGALMDDAAGS